MLINILDEVAKTRKPTLTERIEALERKQIETDRKQAETDRRLRDLEREKNRTL